MTNHSQIADEVQPPSRLLYRGFLGYSRRLVAKRFHAMRVLSGTAPVLPLDSSLLIYGNHSSWWDPLAAVLVHAEYLQSRTFRAPIDADALKKYGVLKRLGFFQLERTAAGAARFLRTTEVLLENKNTAMFLTPQGTFVDARVTPKFDPGIGHIASRVRRTTILPMAVEYTFWNESTPELLFAFGDPISVDNSDSSPKSRQEWNSFLEHQLHVTQLKLADGAISRDPRQFTTLLGGRSGVGGPYDWLRRAKSWLGGRKFDAAHESFDLSQRGTSV